MTKNRSDLKVRGLTLTVIFFCSLTQFFDKAREMEFFKTFIQIPDLPDVSATDLFFFNIYVLCSFCFCAFCVC